MVLDSLLDLQEQFFARHRSNSCGNERLSAAIKKSFDRLMWDSSVLTIDSYFLSYPWTSRSITKKQWSDLFFLDHELTSKNHELWTRHSNQLISIPLLAHLSLVPRSMAGRRITWKNGSLLDRYQVSLRRKGYLAFCLFQRILSSCLKDSFLCCLLPSYHLPMLS